MRKVRLGDYIEQCVELNSEGQYGLSDVRGVANTKGFIPTKANMEGRSFFKFSLIRPKTFAFNRRTTRNGERLGLGFNDSDSTFICTEDYVVFKVRDQQKNNLLPEFLYLNFLRNEFDRYVRWDSWGSATEFFNWENMCQVQIPLPPIEIQKKLVASWQGLKELAENNSQMADPLFSLCRSYLKDLKSQYEPQEIGPFISLYNENNSDGFDYPVYGINKNKEFMPTVANIENVDKRKYKIVSSGIFVFSGMQTGRDMCIRIGLYSKPTPAIVSPAYTTFTVDETKGLLSEYLFLCFLRSEMDRYGWFLSDSSVRSNLDWGRFLQFRIPVPPIEIQKAIVAIYRCAQENKALATEAKALSKDICPALMRQAMEEA